MRLTLWYKYCDAVPKDSVQLRELQKPTDIYFSKADKITGFQVFKPLFSHFRTSRGTHLPQSFPPSACQTATVNNYESFCNKVKVLQSWVSITPGNTPKTLWRALEEVCRERPWGECLLWWWGRLNAASGYSFCCCFSFPLIPLPFPFLLLSPSSPLFLPLFLPQFPHLFSFPLLSSTSFLSASHGLSWKQTVTQKGMEKRFLSLYIQNFIPCYWHCQALSFLLASLNFIAAGLVWLAAFVTPDYSEGSSVCCNAGQI